jgi:hypothetical protein
MNIEVCEVLTKAKIALTLWPYQNEVIDLFNEKNSKNYHIKSVTFQTHSNKSYPKRVNILFAIKFTRNFEY